MSKPSNPVRNDSDILLSVCVIGRNEGEFLVSCFDSLSQLNSINISFETIFVDSASMDDSVELARIRFDKVLCLAPNEFLNAGAARNLGTQYASGNWILYLDGDMELSSEILPAIADLVTSDRFDEGVCGFTENVYPDRSSDIIKFHGNIDGTGCRAFGGAVLLPRRAVLSCGNWSCALFAYEETELYSRLIRIPTKVVWRDARMVTHKTPRVSLVRKLFGGLFPFHSYLGKKYYGAGQVTRLTLRNGNFWEFARLKREGYIMVSTFLLAIITLPWLGYTAIVIPALIFTWNCLQIGLRAATNYLFWIPQVLLGMRRLAPEIQPKLSNFIEKNKKILNS